MSVPTQATVLRWLLAATAVLAVVSVVIPQVDLIVMDWFHTGGNDFVLRGEPFSHGYDAVRDQAVTLLILFVLATTVTALGGRPVLGMTGRRLLVLWITLVGMVGLIVNVVLKNGFGRPRPKNVEAFGGELSFHPPWLPGGACDSNCSFVSGDVAVAFVPLAFALWARPGWPRRLAICASLALGVFVCFMRMLTGSHFPTDVLFGALLTVLTVLALDEWLLRRRVPLPLVDWSPLAARVARLDPRRRFRRANGGSSAKVPPGLLPRVDWSPVKRALRACDPGGRFRRDRS